MEAGQKPSICWGQRRRHLSLGVPHSFYLYLRPALSFQPFFHRPLIPLTRSAPDIGQSLLSSIFSLSLLVSALSFFYITLPLDTLSLSLCAAPTQTLLHGSPLPLFMHSLTSSLFQQLCNSPSFSPAPSLSWASCRFTLSCTISLCSDMFWSIC